MSGGCVTKINLDANVYEMIINHALSNEKEEIMGLLIGNVCSFIRRM